MLSLVKEIFVAIRFIIFVFDPRNINIINLAAAYVYALVRRFMASSRRAKWYISLI